MIGRLRAWLGGIGWLTCWWLARRLPEPWVRRGFEATSRRSWRRNRALRDTIVHNLEPIVGAERLEATVREAFVWYGRYWAETFRMQDLSSEQIDRRMRTEGTEHIDTAYRAGTGAVLATLHLGNWDAGGRWVADRWPLTAVVEVLRPRMVFDRFVAHRRALGITVIPLERGGDATGRCLERLAAGELVALVADRDLSGTGVAVEMFGRRTKMPPGPAVLALRTGAPLIPAAIYQVADGRWDARVMEPITMPAPDDPNAVGIATQHLADAFAELIAHAPEQWHMFARYWVDR